MNVMRLVSFLIECVPFISKWADRKSAKAQRKLEVRILSVIEEFETLGKGHVIVPESSVADEVGIPLPELRLVLYDKHKILERIRNTGHDGSRPTSVAILVPPSAFEPGNATYVEYAKLAYSDVPHAHSVANLGGLVVLADINFEIATVHADRSNRTAESNQSMVFHNARAMRLIEDKSPESLVGLAVSGAISIVSVRIGEAN